MTRDDHDLWTLIALLGPVRPSASRQSSAPPPSRTHAVPAIMLREDVRILEGEDDCGPVSRPRA